MKKVLVLAFSIALLTACGLGKKNSSNTGNSSSASSEKAAEVTPPAVGDLVVAHWAGNTWSEGKVDSTDGPRAKIIWSDNTSPSEVDLVDIYQMPKTEKTIEDMRSTLGAFTNRDAAIAEQVKSMGDKLDSFEQTWKQAAPSEAYEAPMPQIDDKAKRSRARGPHLVTPRSSDRSRG